MTTIFCVKRKASESFKDSLYINACKKLKIDKGDSEIPKKRKLVIYKHIESIPASCSNEEIQSTLLSHFKQNGEDISNEIVPSKRIKISLIYNRQHPSKVTCNGVPMKSVTTPILSPSERLMDKGIYDAFNSNIYDDIFKAVSIGIDINFQRPLADGVTAFMAACASGNMEMIERLRNLGAKANIRNFENENAIDIVNKIFKPRHPDSPEYYHLIGILEELIKEDDEKDEMNIDSNRSDIVYDYYIKTDEVPEEELNSDELYNELLDLNYNEDDENENDDEKDSEDENNSENDYPDEESDDNSNNNGMEYDDNYDDDDMNSSDGCYCGSEKEMNDLEEYYGKDDNDYYEW